MEIGDRFRTRIPKYKMYLDGHSNKQKRGTKKMKGFRRSEKEQQEMAFHPNETMQSKPEQSCQIAKRSQNQSTENVKRYSGQQKKKCSQSRLSNSHIISISTSRI
jgi:hypothetical protein